MIELNKVHHIDNLKGLAILNEKCANLIISDPPYFEVKGDFDFVYDSFDEYLKFMEEQAKLYKRILADNGTLFVYGHAKKIAYVQVIFDKYFNLENSIVWEKKDCQTKKGVDNFRCFAPVSERILMYSNEVTRTGLDVNNFQTLRQYFKELQEFIGLNLKQINETLGHRKAEHCFYHSSTQWDMPIVETYNELKEHFKIDQWKGFKEYETLRQEYETLRRPFNNIMRLFDVMKFDQEAHITRQYDHETVKPEKLSTALILTCSKEGDTVVVPFAGSGTECAMAAKTKRKFYGFEISKKYADMANHRVDMATRQLAMSI